YYYFLQAENGIRDLYVTGVQTCALPIYGKSTMVSVEYAVACTPSTGAAMRPRPGAPATAYSTLTIVDLPSAAGSSVTVITALAELGRAACRGRGDVRRAEAA